MQNKLGLRESSRVSREETGSRLNQEKERAQGLEIP